MSTGQFPRRRTDGKNGALSRSCDAMPDEYGQIRNNHAGITENLLARVFCAKKKRFETADGQCPIMGTNRSTNSQENAGRDQGCAQRDENTFRFSRCARTHH